MALDSELLDKFERDWNDALEHYEARTTAARLGDTSVAPYNRTSLDPKVSAGMQSELFGPLQAKWGLLTEGRGRAAAPTPAQTAPRYFQTRAGVFSVDPLTQQPTKVIDVPQRPEGPTLAEREAMATRQKQLASELRTIDSEIIANQNLLLKTKKDEDKMPIMNRLSSLSRRKAALGTAPVAPVVATAEPAPSPWEVDPMTIPAGNPDNPSMFIGDPMNPVVSDQQMAPLPVGPSAKRGLRVLEIIREGQ